MGIPVSDERRAEIRQKYSDHHRSGRTAVKAVTKAIVILVDRAEFTCMPSARYFRQ
jgi:hypothetical protein